MRMTPLAASIVALSSLSAFGANDAVAHEEATLKSPAASAVAGGTITLNGAGFSPGQEYRILLRGTLDERELRTATAGADSTFSVRMPVPANVRPGQYRVVAVASDGDEVATLDLPVLAAQSRPGPESHADPSARGAEAAARSDERVIERSRTGIEWGIIGLLIGLTAGAGAGLLQRP